MSKYDRANTTGEKDAIDAYLEPNEYVYWKGKGNALNYIVNSAGPMTPFALIWLFVDGTILLSFFGSGMMGEAAFFIIPFFAIHLIPVWIWLGSMIKGAKLWKNSTYAITDRQIFIKNGATNMIVRWYKYDCITSVKKHTSILDDLLGTVDLQFYLVNGSHVDILDVKKSEINLVYEHINQRIQDANNIRKLREQQQAALKVDTPVKMPEPVENNTSNSQYADNYNPYA